MINRNCLKCGSQISLYPSQAKRGRGEYCSRACKGAGRDISGVNNPRWNGGVSKHHSGYILVRAPKNHPYRTKAGYIREHRLVMEEKLGRYLLPTEDVDHINGIKTDNRSDNLQLMPSRSEHLRLEHKRGIYREHLSKLNKQGVVHVA